MNYNERRHTTSDTTSDTTGATRDNATGGTGGFPAPERPEPPRPVRLNRSALTIAAVVLGLLVLAAVVFVQPPRTPAGSRSAPLGSIPELPPHTYLELPQRGSGGEPESRAAVLVPSRGRSEAERPGNSLSDRRHSTDTADSAESGGRTRGALTASEWAYGTGASAPAAPATSLAAGLAAGTQPATAPTTQRSRAVAYRSALSAPLTASTLANETVLAAAGDATGWERGVRAMTGAAEAEERGVSGPPLGRLASEHTELRHTGPMLVHAALEPAPGPLCLQAGTVIPAVLVTAIDSDLPGDVLAQVARDVYDSRTQHTLLIPRGSRLVGHYDARVGAGQDRLLVTWMRVLLPDGRSVMLPGLETKDRAGAGGLHDRVDRHTSRTLGTAALLSLIGAGVQLSQPRGGYGPLGVYPSPGQVAAGAVGQEFADVATQMLRQNLGVPSTVRIRQGMPFNVFLTTDLAFDAPYAEPRPTGPYANAGAPHRR